MNWHKISEELPPENKPILFRRQWGICLNNYNYFVGRFDAKYNDIYADRAHNSNIQDWEEWTEIEPPEDSKDD
jgi:hypothetical protein